MKRKLLSILLTLALVTGTFAVFPLTAMAEEDRTAAISEENAKDSGRISAQADPQPANKLMFGTNTAVIYDLTTNQSGTGWTWTAATSTMSLSSSYNGEGISFDRSQVVNLTLTGNVNINGNSMFAGVNTVGNLNIEAGAYTLSINNTFSSAMDSAIYVGNGALTIGSGTVNVTDVGNAIDCYNGITIQNNAVVTAKSTSEGLGITTSGDMLITGGSTVTATGKDTGAIEGITQGISVGGNLTVSGSASVNPTGLANSDIRANGNIIINTTGTVKAIAPSTIVPDSFPAAIRANGTISIQNGSVTATATAAGSNGIYAARDIAISGGTVNTSAPSSLTGGVICAGENNTISITGAKVSVTGGEVTATATATNGNGILASSDITVSGGTVNVTAKGTGYALKAYNGDNNSDSNIPILTVNISGGTVKLVNNNTPANMISAFGGLDYTDGSLFFNGSPGGSASGTLYITGSHSGQPGVPLNADQSGTGWTYKAATATLNFNKDFVGSEIYFNTADAVNITMSANVTVSTTGKAHGIKAGGNLNINAGNYTLDVTENHNADNGYAIHAAGSLTIKGGTVNATHAGSKMGAGILGEKGVIIMGNAVVTSKSLIYGHGIFVKSGNMQIVGNSTVTATGKLPAGLLSGALPYGINLYNDSAATNLLIGGNANVNPGGEEDSQINVYKGDITINTAGTVKAIYRDNGMPYYAALYAGGKINIQSGTVTASTTAYHGNGIQGKDGISISGGTVYAATNSNIRYAMKTDSTGSTVSISGGTVILFNTYPNSANTISAPNGLNQTGGRIFYNEMPTFTASLNPANIIFPAAKTGYGVQGAQQLTITNTGTGTLTGVKAALSAGAGKLEISAALTPSTIEPDGTATVSIRPKVGLSAGTHTGTLTITGDNGFSATAPLSFTVNADSGSGSGTPVDGAGGSGGNGDGNNQGGGNNNEDTIVNIGGAAGGTTVEKITDKTYTGKQITPSPVLKLNGKALAKGTDYAATYKSNIKIGKATVTLTGKGKYTGTKTIYFNIVPKKTSISKVAVGKKQLKITWKKVAAAQKITKYQVRYKVKGAKKWTTKTVPAKSNSLTIKKLNKGKTYQIQVSSYKTVSKVKYYSAWSAVKTSKKIK